MTCTRKKSIVLALCLATAALLCSNFSVQAETVQNNPQITQGKLSAIESITANSIDDNAELIIKLTAPATYTSYKTTAPLRLIIDLSQVTQGTLVSPVEINKANFKKVTVNRYDTDAGSLTRVEIELEKDLEAVLMASPEKPGELKISFPGYRPSDTASAKVVEPKEIKSESSAEPVAPLVPASKPAEQKKAENERIASDRPVTRTLNGIVVKDNKILMSINGGIGEFKSFRLNKPERYVVDLLETKSLLPNRLIQINSSGVATARLGLYPDKVRVVFDALSNSFPEANAIKSAEGVTIVLGKIAADESSNTKRQAVVSSGANGKADDNLSKDKNKQQVCGRSKTLC